MTEPLIDEATRQALKTKFESELRDDVHLTVFVGEANREYGDFTVRLVQELNALDRRIQYTIHQDGNGVAAAHGIESTPTVLIGWEQGYRIKYTGAPAGHEAGGFIETIALVSRGESGLQPASVEKLDQVDREATIQVFVTPTCPHCPRAVLLANRIAIAARGQITAEAVEASQNMELARQFNVSSVPQQVINGDMASVSIGAQPEKAFVDAVLSYSASRYEEILAQEAARLAEATRLVDDPTGTLTLTDENFDEAVAKYPNLVVDCWAEWCMPCRIVGPVIEELAGEYQGKVVFGKLDVDHNQAVAGRHGVMSIPTLLYFKDGQLAGTKVGALPKPQLAGALEEFGLV